MKLKPVMNLSNSTPCHDINKLAFAKSIANEYVCTNPRPFPGHLYSRLQHAARREKWAFVYLASPRRPRHKHAPFLNNDHPDISISLGPNRSQDQETTERVQQISLPSIRHCRANPIALIKGRDFSSAQLRETLIGALMAERIIAQLGVLLLLACAASAQQVSSGNNATTSGSGSGSGSGYRSKRYTPGPIIFNYYHQ